MTTPRATVACLESRDLLVCILAADATAIATVNLPADHPLRMTSRKWRDVLNAEAARRNLPGCYARGPMGEGHWTLASRANSALSEARGA